MNARGSLVRGMCPCGNKAVSTGISPSGKQQFRTRCRTCIRKAQALRKDFCEKCFKKWTGGIKFDTDHIDGNPSNNDPSNVQTLCRPCHAEKSRENKENCTKYGRQGNGRNV